LPSAVPATSLAYQLNFHDFVAAYHAAAIFQKQKGQASLGMKWLAWLLIAAVTLAGIALILYSARRNLHAVQVDVSEIANRYSSSGAWIVFAIIQLSFVIAFKQGRKRGWAVMSAGTLLCCVVAAFFLLYRTRRASSDSFGWIVVAVMAISYWRTFYGRNSYRALWKQFSHLHGKKWLCWDADGFQLADTDSRLNYEWRALKAWLETGDLLLLFVSDLAFHIVPKRAFAADESLLDAFRQALVNASEAKGHGFPVLEARRSEQ
jgi:hypothetical protein